MLDYEFLKAITKYASDRLQIVKSTEEWEEASILLDGIETEINDIDLNEQVQKFSNKFVGNVDALICIFKSPIFTNKFEIFNEKISIKKGTYRYMGAAFINTLLKYKVIEM